MSSGSGRQIAVSFVIIGRYVDGASGEGFIELFYTLKSGYVSVFFDLNNEML